MQTVDIYSIVDEISAADAMDLGIDDVSDILLADDVDTEVMTAHAGYRKRTTYPTGVDSVMRGRHSEETDDYSTYSFEDR